MTLSSKDIVFANLGFYSTYSKLQDELYYNSASFRQKNKINEYIPARIVFDLRI